MMLSILRVWVEFYLQNAENKSVYNKGYFCLLKKTNSAQYYVCTLKK